MSNSKKHDAKITDGEQSVLELSEILYTTMICLEPGVNSPLPDWTELREFDRDFYKDLIMAVLDYGELTIKALAYHDFVVGSAKMSKKS